MQGRGDIRGEVISGERRYQGRGDIRGEAISGER